MPTINQLVRKGRKKAKRKKKDKKVAVSTAVKEDTGVLDMEHGYGVMAPVTGPADI